MSNSNYYDQGGTEPMRETAVTLKKMEMRRKLTSDSHRLVLVLVGLPGRGKSFIARKLYSYFLWSGNSCKVFNVGKYRRAAVNSFNAGDSKSPACDANFFDSNNQTAANLRHQCAALAMKDMIKWLDDDDQDQCECSEDSDQQPDLVVEMEGSMDDEAAKRRRKLIRRSSSSSSESLASRFVPLTDRVAIFDATNSTKARRNWIVDTLTNHGAESRKPIGIVFVESICDDKELLEENFKYKVTNSPDFSGLSLQDGIADLRDRVKKYEETYQTITDDSCSYIKIFNLSSKLMANQIYGRMSKLVVPALMAWNIGTRPIFICRAGETSDDAKDTEGRRTRRNKKGDSIGSDGRTFRDALYAYVDETGKKYMNERSNAYSRSLNTGTSISGGVSMEESFLEHQEFPPCKIMTSTMPRAWQTVFWEQSPNVNFDVVSNLNPLDKGDFTGLELPEIQEKDSEWYSKLAADPYNTRFPGGECYRDVVKRLESCIIDMEQSVVPVLVVSHVSVIQVLLAYFRGTPVDECTKITVPLHTVIKLRPVSGGSWIEEHVELSHVDENGKLHSTQLPVTEDNSAPIWDDHEKIC